MEKSFYSLDKNDPIRKSISKAILKLRENAFSGIQISKKLIPKNYIERYEINNLWKIDLVQGWRLLYTVSSDDEVELISAILDWFNHKNYEIKMKY